MEKQYLENLKNIRIAKKYSQLDMAEKLGFTQNNYSKIERGLGELSVDRLYEIAEILEVSIFQILVDKDEKTALEKITKEVENNFNKELYNTKLNEFKEDFRKDFEQKFEEGLKEWFDNIGSQLTKAFKNPIPETPEQIAERQLEREKRNAKIKEDRFKNAK